MVLKIDQGGTNSTTPLTDGKVLVSDSGALKETTTTTAQVNLLNPINEIQTGTGTNDKLITRGLADDLYSAGGHLDQLHIYYVGSAGDDSNDGDSIEAPFLTIPAAISAINAQTPSASNRFAIYLIDSGTFTLAGEIIPKYTTLWGPRSKVTGTFAIDEEVYVRLREFVIPASGNGIFAQGLTKRVVNIDYVTDNVGSNATYLLMTTGAEIKLYFKEIRVTGSGSKFFSLNTGASIYYNGDFIRYDTVSFNDGSGTEVGMVMDEGTLAAGFDTYIRNSSAPVHIEAANPLGFILKSGGVEVFRNKGPYPQWTNTPLLNALISGVQANVTGDGTLWRTKFANVLIDRTSIYNSGTGFLTINTTGYYQVTMRLSLTDLQIVHTKGIVSFNNGGTSPETLKSNFWNQSVTGDYNFIYSEIIKLSAGDSITVDLTVGTVVTPKTVDVIDGSYSVYLLTI